MKNLLKRAKSLVLLSLFTTFFGIFAMEEGNTLVLPADISNLIIPSLRELVTPEVVSSYFPDGFTGVEYDAESAANMFMSHLMESNPDVVFAAMQENDGPLGFWASQGFDENTELTVEQKVAACDAQNATEEFDIPASGALNIWQKSMLFQDYPGLNHTEFCGYYAAFAAVCMLNNVDDEAAMLAQLNDRDLFNTFIDGWLNVIRNNRNQPAGCSFDTLRFLGAEEVKAVLNSIAGFDTERVTVNGDIDDEIAMFEKIINFNTDGVAQIVILNTGHGHWITALFKKEAGNTKMILADSMAQDRRLSEAARGVFEFFNQ
jgi:hypothetical protein